MAAFTTFSQSNLSTTDLILTYVSTNARSRSRTALEIRACYVFRTITFSCCGPAQVDPWRTYISVTRDLTRPQSFILIPITPRAPFGRASLLRSKERGLGTSQTRNSDRPLRKDHNFLNEKIWEYFGIFRNGLMKLLIITSGLSGTLVRTKRKRYLG